MKVIELHLRCSGVVDDGCSHEYPTDVHSKHLPEEGQKEARIKYWEGSYRKYILCFRPVCYTVIPLFYPPIGI